MRITSKGQVTIPQEIREHAGLLPNTEVEFIIDGDLVLLVQGRDRATAAEPRPAARRAPAARIPVSSG